MKCPSCAAPCGEEAAECPACGLIFAKWRDRQEKERLAAVEALEGAAKPKAAANPWVGRSVAGVVVLAWMLGLCFYAARRARVKRAPLGVETGTFVEVRDPKTGAMRRMPIRRLGGVPAPSSSGQ